MKGNQTFCSCLVLIASFIFYSCRKPDQDEAADQRIAGSANEANRGNGVTPYQFERINVHNFHSQGWKEQQVNIANGFTVFSDESDHVEIVCGPENNSDPRLTGAVLR